MSSYTEAQTLCQQAEALLFQASQADYQTQPLLHQAACLYQEVLQMDVELAEPYVGISFLLMLLGRKAEAQDYLKKAEALDPANLQWFRIQRALHKSPESPDLPVSLQRIDRLSFDDPEDNQMLELDCEFELQEF